MLNQKGKRRILFFTSRLPFPPESGRTRTLYDYCRYFSQWLGFSVAVVTWADGRQTDELPPFIEKLYLLPPPSILMKIPSLIWHTFLRSDWPLQVGLYYSSRTQQKIEEIFKLEKPDVVVADMVRTALYFDSVKLPKILDLDDLLSVRYGRQISGCYIESPYGRLTENLPQILGWLFNNSLINRWILRKEKNLLERFEIQMAYAYDATVLVSPVEAEHLCRVVGQKKVFAIPPAVDDILLTQEWWKPVPGVIAFAGAMNVAHNEAAVLYFYHEIMPLIKQYFPSVRFRIVGKNPSVRVRELAADPAIEVTGWVEKPYEQVGNAEVFVAPLTFGSGIKLKILEALAIGVPVVTTSIGAEGIGALPGEHLSVADNAEDFAKAVLELLASPTLRAKRSQAGREFVKERYRFETVMRTWDEVFSSIGVF